MIIETKFSLRDRTVIDQDLSLVGFITAIQVRESRCPVYEVSYVHNGDPKTAWIEEWRLGW